MSCHLCAHARRAVWRLIFARYGLGFFLLTGFGQPGFAQTTPPLNFENNYFVTGDYVVAGVGLRGLGVNGFATKQFHHAGREFRAFYRCAAGGRHRGRFPLLGNGGEFADSVCRAERILPTGICRRTGNGISDYRGCHGESQCPAVVEFGRMFGRVARLEDHARLRGRRKSVFGAGHPGKCTG